MPGSHPLVGRLLCCADIQFETKKVEKTIKDAAKRNDMATCKVLGPSPAHLPSDMFHYKQPYGAAAACMHQLAASSPLADVLTRLSVNCSGLPCATLPCKHPVLPCLFCCVVCCCSIQVLAKEIIHSRKAVSRLYVNKAQMISIGNALTEQLGEKQQRPRASTRQDQ